MVGWKTPGAVFRGCTAPGAFAILRNRMIVYSNGFGNRKNFRPHSEEHDPWFVNLQRTEISTQDCFLCGRVLSYPVVMWQGSSESASASGMIFFHEPCAAHFVFSLIDDVQELYYLREQKRISPNGEHLEDKSP